MKYLVVGLGNIGSEYEETRHNIGFKILDAFSEASNISFKEERYGSLSQAKNRGRQIILLKPNTYMNLSGKAVRYWMQKENIPIERVLIITDDLSLPFGTLRVRAKGSDAGHNGLKSIIQELGSQAFPRLKFGISNDFSKGQQVDYVLGKWSDEENKLMSERIELCVSLIKDFSFLSIGQLMSNYNGK
jgi:PTH1 family peptidyl-tRNA hydrolase